MYGNHYQFRNNVFQPNKKYQNSPNLIKKFSYLKRYLFKINPQIYNHSKLIKHYQKENENTTNKVVESINSFKY